MAVLVVLVTVPDRKTADRLSRALVGEKLAACVNIVPGLRSRYWWQGKIEEAGELLLLIKTVRRRWTALVRRLRQLHPYSVPEILALPVAAGHPPYLAWVRDSVRRKK